MKDLLKNKKFIAFIGAIAVAAATIFLGVDKDAAEKLVGGCQKAVSDTPAK